MEHMFWPVKYSGITTEHSSSRTSIFEHFQLQNFILSFTKGFYRSYSIYEYVLYNMKMCCCHYGRLITYEEMDEPTTLQTTRKHTSSVSFDIYMHITYNKMRNHDRDSLLCILFHEVHKITT